MLLAVSQQSSEDLARRRLRDRLHKLDASLDPFVGSFPGLHVLLNLLFGTWPRLDDVSLWDFAGTIIRHRNDGTIRHA